MKHLLAIFAATFLALPSPARAASDTDVTLSKVNRVVIGNDIITIEADAARTRVTLIEGGHDPKHKGDTWNGLPVTRVHVVSNRATFSIRRPPEAAPGGPLEKAWNDSLKAASALQDGERTGRIGYYAPDIVIKGNRIDSIKGPGFLYRASP